MKVLIVNASPRPEGNITAMLAAMCGEVSDGVEVTTIRIDDLNVSPCTGCMSCRERRTCVLPDDGAQSFLRQLSACDLLVLGVPCYWGNMPGTLKLLFDRIVYGLIGEGRHGLPVPLCKGKKAVIVSTCTTPFPFNRLFRQSAGAVRAVRAILRLGGFRTVATVQVGGTRHRPVAPHTLNRCRRIMRKHTWKHEP